MLFCIKKSVFTENLLLTIGIYKHRVDRHPVLLLINYFFSTYQYIRLEFQFFFPFTLMYILALIKIIYRGGLPHCFQLKKCRKMPLSLEENKVSCMLVSTKRIYELDTWSPLRYQIVLAFQQKKYLEILLDLAKGLRVCSEVLVPNSLSLHARFSNC